MPLPASAQEVLLRVDRGGDALRERLEANSLLLRDPGEEGRTAQDIVAAARADYARLVGTLYDFGRFAPVVSITLDGREASSLSPFSVPSSISRIVIDIEAGRSYRFGTADIGPLAPGTELPEDFRPRGRATTPVLQDTTSSAIDGWRAVGNAVADVAGQSISADHGEATLDARITIAPGPVVSFGTLIPSGQQRMRAERVVEIAGLPQGVTYSPDILDRVQERLRDTGVFSAVALEEQPLGADNSMDIVATLVESPLRRFGFGAELSSDAGAQVSAFWLHRNLFGGAERLRVEGEVRGIGEGEISTEDIGGVDVELRARLSRPATFTPDTLAYGEIGIFYLDEPLFELVGAEVEVGVEHWFSPELEGALGIGLFTGRYDDALGERDGTLVYLPGELTWDRRDDPLDPASGFFLSGTATPFLEFGSGVEDGAGLRLTADARGYVSVGENGSTVFASRAQIGSVIGGSVTSIPPDYLFYSGGADTVRGQEYQSLGAIQNGVDAGGRSFGTLASEARIDIGDTNFGVVAFADVGYVAADAAFSDGDWHAGAGLGVRYATPFGPIRVDVATPVRGSGVGEDIFLYIGIGQSF